MANFVLNAGHTKSGVGSGAVGYLIESIETRKVVNAVARYLKGKGHTVKIINVDKATTQNEYLSTVVKKANETNCDVFVSIHFNASVGGRGYGTESFTWRGSKTPQAVGVCKELSKLGFFNRGVKDGSNLYVIKKTKMNALLIEVCFVDNFQDSRIYESVGVNAIAQAITRGLLYEQ